MFKNILIAFLLSLSINSYAGPFVGFAQGVHLGGEQLNDSHPYTGLTAYNFGVMVYLNSYQKTAVATFYEFKAIEGLIKYSLRLGVTSGYRKRMKYGDHTFNLDRRFFFNDKIMLFAVPCISLYDDGVGLELTLLGDSLNLGFLIEF